MAGNKEVKPVRRMLLGLTDRCNMRCSYCYVPLGRRDMTRAEVRRHLTWFIDAPGDREKLVYLYGGEPFLVPELMVDAVGYGQKIAVKRGKKLSFIVVTNGTLASRLELSFFLEHQMKVMVSFSGRGRAHDRVRPLRGGKGTYATALATLEKFVALLPNDRLWLSATVTPSGVRTLDADLRYFEKLGVKNFHVEPVIHPDYLWDKQAAVLKGAVEDFLSRLTAQAASKDKSLFNTLLCRQLEMLEGLYLPQDYVRYNDTRFYPGRRRMYDHFELDQGQRPVYPVWDILRQVTLSAATDIVRRTRCAQYVERALERAI
ncbi:MAG: radical SAM protein [Candidatus Omnitrophota bacterium]